MHEKMYEGFHAVIATSVDMLTLVAGFLLFLGFIISTVKWVQQAVSEGSTVALGTYRRKLGRTILIGLELLLAATILKTIVSAPTIEAFGLILMTVAIRTALGWTTSLEVYGRWPWQN